MKIQKPRGTRDILPEDQKYWQFIFNCVNKRCQGFGFGKIETPMFEAKQLYVRGIGETTDIVEKEMYEVSRLGNITSDDNEDKESLVLRPEYTAGVIRAYLENGMQTWPQPVKLYSYGPLFRYDKPQKGRYRQLWQFNFEIIGDDNPLTDTLLILLIWQIFCDLGLKENIIVDINSIGCKSCRPKIRKKIVEYFRKYSTSLCVDCQKRLEFNPLRILDCKVEKCQKIAVSSPQILDNLCDECKKFFTSVLEYLDQINIPYDLNPRLVRGLDYYTRTTFEIRDKNDVNRQASLGGGGRYDNLIELLGGKSTPAVGFAGGIDRIIEKLKEKEVKVPDIKGVDIFIVQLGDKAKKIALSLISDLGQKGFGVSCLFGKESLKAQLRDANKMKAKFALIIGQREALDDTIIVKNMDEVSQETISMEELDNYLYNKLSK